MIEESYDSIAFNNKTQFIFESVGAQGVVVKIVVFNRIMGERWNVGFGDLRENSVDDSVFTNNNDVRKVLSTVAQTIYSFSEAHPKATIVIFPIDVRRKQFYNAVFQRHIVEIAQKFHVFGNYEGQVERYSLEKSYDSFELICKFES